MTKYEIAAEIEDLNPKSCMRIIYEAFTKKS